ncbi:alpha/beta hydrolase [Saccharothrix syringae]|nr:alpha/beta hydrolase-fold protein [Saccharothrix syringae]
MLDWAPSGWVLPNPPPLTWPPPGRSLPGRSPLDWSLLDWSLLAGSRPMVAAVAAGAVALAALLAGRGGPWWLRRVPVAAAVAVVPVAVAVPVLRRWGPVRDPLPPVVPLCAAVALLALALAATRLLARPRRARRLAWVPAAVVVVLACAELVNAHYGQYPTVRAALGLPSWTQTTLDQVLPPGQPVAATAGDTPLDSTWNPPKNLPATGVVAPVTIPGRVSRFPARPGWVWLPPAYRVSPRPLLPVLVLVNGQPGNPRDWLDGGLLARRMDRYAAAHRGLAPVVVVPDDLGGTLDNPMCLDSHLGNARTYLARDVPDWVTATLQVDPAPRAWAFGGFSHGGTCAVQMAVTAPERYPTFLAISGEDEPRRGSREQSVADAFGGDTAAFTAVNPRDVMAARRFPGTAGHFVVGADDEEFRAQGERMYAAARGAGMDVALSVLPGGHGWEVWGPGLEQQLPWLGTRLGITS